MVGTAHGFEKRTGRRCESSPEFTTTEVGSLRNDDTAKFSGTGVTQADRSVVN